MSSSEESDYKKLQLRLGGANGKGPVEVLLFHDEEGAEMTTIVTEYPGDEIQDIDLSKWLHREGYELVEAV